MFYFNGLLVVEADYVDQYFKGKTIMILIDIVVYVSIVIIIVILLPNISCCLK